MTKRKSEPEPETRKKAQNELENSSDGMGEFEDRFYDEEFDSEEEFVEEDLDSLQGEDLAEKMENLKVFLPGSQMEKDEVLVADQSAYDLLHSLNVEWPCLSFDILKDKLGTNRSSVNFIFI
jgi:ribosome assembly protein RRB1